MNKLYLFKDQEDYIKKVTEDPIINVIGTKGSGKTTSSLEYIEDSDTIVINCDRLFELPSTEKEDKELTIIRDQLKKKYGKVMEGEEFSSCYLDIVDYILSKHKKGFIEGNVIQEISPLLLKGTIIVKKTGVFKSYIRAVKRDYHNEYFMNLEKKEHKYFYKLTRLYKISKRRKSVFLQAREIEKIMETLEDIKE